MKIDRHNYEEYFLLYIDNELTVDQKKQVELFIKENPDLEEELIIFQQSRLIPDTIVFEEKHLLMKEENNSFINLNNYEEWLVLYVDNELNDKEKTIVEKFAATHPQVQTELGLFQQTKLQPEEEFNFPDKSLLYRKEEKVRIISMTWWRVAVAAILIITAGITLYSVLGKKNNSGASFIDDTAGPKKEQILNPVKPVSPDQQQQQPDNPGIKREQKQVAISTPVEKQNQNENKKQRADNLSLSDKELVKGNDDILQKRSVIADEINTVKPNDPQITNVLITGNKSYKQIINDSLVTKQLSETPDEYASNTENKKLRGLFRKATRFIERTSGINPANDDNRVLIGGMAINLK
jgi:hypothetical protein